MNKVGAVCRTTQPAAMWISYNAGVIDVLAAWRLAHAGMPAAIAPAE